MVNYSSENINEGSIIKGYDGA